MKVVGTNGVLFSRNMFHAEWRKPVNISIGLHIIVLILAILAPGLFDRQPRLPEIYTVNLFTAAEVTQPEALPVKTPAAEAPDKPAIKEIEPETKKPAVSIQPAEPEPVPAVKTVITRPVSLKPLKMKVKVGKTLEEEAFDKAKLSQVVHRLKAGAAQREARDAADKAAKDAVNKLADAIKTNTATTATAASESGKTSSSTGSPGVSGPRKTGIEPGFYEKMYYSAVHQKIQNHWVLPDLQNWDTSLEARVVITIRKDGVVTDSFFEKKSENIRFNQFVLKTLKDASPLPPFPNKLKKNTWEIGLVFKPGELY